MTAKAGITDSGTQWSREKHVKPGDRHTQFRTQLCHYAYALDLGKSLNLQALALTSVNRDTSMCPDDLTVLLCGGILGQLKALD